MTQRSYTGQSSGTSVVANIDSQVNINFIIVKHWSKAETNSLSFDAAPPNEAPRPEVLSMIERSSRDYADIWAELAKY